MCGIPELPDWRSGRIGRVRSLVVESSDDEEVVIGHVDFAGIEAAQVFAAQRIVTGQLLFFGADEIFRREDGVQKNVRVARLAGVFQQRDAFLRCRQRRRRRRSRRC